MKNIFLYLLLVSGFCQAQNILTDTVYKKGIYKTFEEFKTNSPSIELKYPVTSYTSKLTMDDWTSYRLDISKEESEAIGPVYGFCNGYSIYVAPKPREIYKLLFEQVLYVGQYSFFQDQEGSELQLVIANGGIGVGTGGPKPIVDKIINMETGEIIMLTNGEMKKLLSDNPTLLAEFKKDSKKEFRRMKYLKRYLGAKAAKQ
jgi:hypothetical protein